MLYNLFTINKLQKNIYIALSIICMLLIKIIYLNSRKLKLYRDDEVYHQKFNKHL